ncbi:MAG: EamA family transporter [Opitutaceae bacterium]|jgi:drug/metabolite transporter (DMT)-like permease|nr:EamA family transporter [Opitutaceae bacterium]
MSHLFIVSLIWAMSFGLIKDRLAGLDATALGVVRTGLALIVFLPFWRPGKIRMSDALRYMAIGALEFGLMYVFYMAAFRFLAAYQVAVFTIFTPLWIAALEAFSLRKLPVSLVAATLLAIAGAAVINWRTFTPAGSLLAGFLLVQASNICFAAGQLMYRKLRHRAREKTPDTSLFAWLYLGALLITLLTSTVTTDWSAFRPDASQWLVLVYLGVIASGLCFFWWNIGATRVGTATLAVFNNAKIPLAVACSLLLFRESANIPRLLLGGGLLVLAILVARRQPRV